ncbi:MAG: flavodoxin domain-containing protein [Actinomycetota bacterium]|nr:flavodoxin domain-containing protein [Actinomycetota bacterium]
MKIWCREQVTGRSDERHSVYKSWWGSCRRIAEAIGQGLQESGHELQVVVIEDAGSPDPSLDLVVIGAATRWPGTWPKIKRYAKKAIKAGLAGKPLAVFSTGGTVNDEKPLAQASEVLYELLESGGLVALAPPFKAAIKGYKAPGRGENRGVLPESEVERAREFGGELGGKLSSRD